MENGICEVIGAEKFSLAAGPH